MINRKLLAKAAIAAELDKTPDFALQKDRANEQLLAQTMQKKLLDALPASAASSAGARQL